MFRPQDHHQSPLEVQRGVQVSSPGAEKRVGDLDALRPQKVASGCNPSGVRSIASAPGSPADPRPLVPNTHPEVVPTYSGRRSDTDEA